MEKGYYSPVSDDDTILDLLAETDTMPYVSPQPAAYCPPVSDISSCDETQSILESFQIPSTEDVKIFIDDFELEFFDSGMVFTEEIIREVLQPNGDGIQLRSGRRLFRVSFTRRFTQRRHLRQRVPPVFRRCKRCG